ncbi:MAG: peptidylprolyl isomerase [Candidatus Nomurabacteria bacterium]
MKKNWKNILYIILALVIVIFLINLVLKKSNVSDNIVIDNNSNATSTENVATDTNILKDNKKNNMDNTNENKTYTEAILHTSLGVITFEFSSNKPLTTENFKKLAAEGFYNGVKFHRVIKGFMIQTGDPLSKDNTKKAYWGTGGPGYKFQDELTGTEKYEIGTVAMANSGPNTNGSQFFIMTSNTQLPPAYTVFGKVVAGIDVAMKIQDVATDSSDKPLEDITISSIELK